MKEIDSQSILSSMTPDIYQRFKTAVELRKWPNGQMLSHDQLNTCLQAIIVYEEAHLPVDQRTGYVPPKTQPCDDESHIHTIETPIKWQNKQD